MSTDPGSSAGQSEPLRVVADRYELGAQLARGGMGVVWVATDRKLCRKVALKVLIATETDDAVARFEREAKTVAALRSDHVVQVHDYGTENGVPFLVMELLEGESLGERLQRQGSLDLDECAELLVQITRGLRAAHDAGLVHRDLKPSNIFLARRDDGFVVKLLDFGLVKPSDRRVDTEFTASGVVLGTPQYMSPEQARGIRLVDHRADLWSVGVIVLRALTGANPFASESVGDAVIKICIDPIPKASEIVPVPPTIDAFFARALARDPDERFSSIDELARAFLEVAERGDLASALFGPSASRARLADPGDGFSELSTSRRFGPGPGTEALRNAAAGHAPTSATIGATLATSIARPATRSRSLLIPAIGAAALLAGGLFAFALLRPPAGAPNAAGAATARPTGTEATPTEAPPRVDVSAPPAPTTHAADDALAEQARPADGASPAVSSALDAGIVPGSAVVGSSKPWPAAGAPPATGTERRSSDGVWLPTESKPTSGKDAPKWY